MISSTRSRESASRSSWKDASSLISLSSTPSCSVRTSLTRSKTSSRDAAMAPHWLGGSKARRSYRARRRSYFLERACGQLLAQALDHTVLGAAGREADRIGDRVPAGIAVRDHREAAQ